MRGSDFPIHGGLDDQSLKELGVSVHDILDLSVNVSPFGPTPGVVAAMQAAPLERYPDPSGLVVRQKIAPKLKVEAAQIMLGNGACELLWLLARSLVGPGKLAFIAEPTFSEFTLGVQAAGGRIERFVAKAEDGFRLNIPSLIAKARKAKAAALYLCNPNNPTGTYIPPAGISELALALPDTQIVLDESFLSLSHGYADAACVLPKNVIRVRSLTKSHGIPGLRLGYLIAPADLIRFLEQNRPTWSVGSPSQRAIAAAIVDDNTVKRTREKLLGYGPRLIGSLAARGLVAVPSQTVFCWVHVGDGDALKDSLLNRFHILIRSGRSFAFPAWVRIAARRPESIKRLMDALDVLMAEGWSPPPPLNDRAP